MSLVTMFFIGAKKWPGITKVMEECAEVIQVCAKLQAALGEILHWDGTNLKERLEDEIGDAYAAFDFVIHHSGLNPAKIAARRREKRALFEKWQVDQSTPAFARDIHSEQDGFGTSEASVLVQDAPDQRSNDTAIQWDIPRASAGRPSGWNPPLAPGLSSPSLAPGQRLVAVHWKMTCGHRDDDTGSDWVDPSGECRVCFQTGIEPAGPMGVTP